MPASEFNFKTDAPMAGSALTALHEFFCGNRAEATPDTIAAGDLFSALLRLVGNLITNSGVSISSDVNGQQVFTLFEWKPKNYGDPPTGNQKFGATITDYPDANGANPRHNVVFRIGYNPNREAGDQSGCLVIEAAFGPTNGLEQMEVYFEFFTAGGVTGQRTFSTVFDRVTGLQVTGGNAVNFLLSNPGGESLPVDIGTTGPLTISSGSGAGNNGSITFAVTRPDGTIYGGFTRDYGFVVDGRAYANDGNHGFGVLAPANPQRKPFYYNVNDIDVFLVDALGAVLLPTLADSAAANSRLYFSSTAGKLVWKDSGGVVRNLY